ncbi:TPA: hypothetical protein ACK3Q6_007661 [Burkholderia cepacia]
MKHYRFDPSQPSVAVSLDPAKDWHQLPDPDRDSVVQLAQKLVDVVLSAGEAEQVKQTVTGLSKVTMAAVIDAVVSVVRARPVAPRGPAA